MGNDRSNHFVVLPNGDTKLYCSRCSSPRDTSCARDDCAVRGELPASAFIAEDWTPCPECCGLNGRHQNWCARKVTN
jgi:hypothetical protein